MQHREPLACGRLMRAMCLMSALMAIPASAAAQDGGSVIIMKFEQVDASPDVVGSLNESLNAGIETQGDMKVKPGGEMTIKDLALTAGCGQPDASCLKTLREFVDADRVIFGSVKGVGETYVFSLKMFDFEDGSFVSQIDEQTIQGDVDHVRDVLPAVVEGFLYGPVGSLTVAVSGVDSADVLLDGVRVGEAPGTVSELPLGEHVVTVRTSDGDEKSETIVLRRNDEAALSFAFAPTVVVKSPQGDSSGPSVVPGIISIGIGVIGLGVGAFSSLQVQEASSDADKLVAGGFINPDAGAFTDSDAVAAAKAENLDPAAIDKQGKTFQTIQWVGYGVGAVGVGVGIFLLARALGGSEKETAALPFDFGFSPTNDGAAASFRARF